MAQSVSDKLAEVVQKSLSAKRPLTSPEEEGNKTKKDQARLSKPTAPIW